MTQTSNRVLDEFAKLMTDAAGVATGMRREAETFMRGRAERLLAEMDLVSREEFDAVKAMAERAREENERLAAELEALKKKVSATPRKKPAASGGTKKSTA